jgi:uncharacterized Tic20 family protein
MPAPVSAPLGGSDPKSQAAMSHYLGAGLLFLTGCLGFVGPMVIMGGAGKNDPFIRDQAVEATNFQLTILIAWIVSFVLVFVVIGFVLLPLVYLAGIIFPIMGGMAASRGEWYRYPFSIKFVKP